MLLGHATGLPPPTKRRKLDVALVGYQDQGNLGMGYLAAVLVRDGYRVDMVEVRGPAEDICDQIVRDEPLVVGFSLIFQFFLPQFRRLARTLRRAGVRSHFTIGGHYASLCPEEVLAQFPELDSIARFEGEETLLELVRRLEGGQDWRATPGLAYLDQGQMAESVPRPLVHDLDTLPFPLRPYQPERIIGYPTMPVLASRGCARRCSFCSIHTFYREAEGRVVRTRQPEWIVKEMVNLFEQRGVRIFLFQDDDFPIWNKVGRRWAEELVERIKDSVMADQILWKISCRAEYVDREFFSYLRDAGLFLVYMGIESGVEQGLKVLNKQMTLEQNLAAVRTLKELGIWMSYGFMLLDPSSTFASVRQNISFLKEIVGDGYAAATFCRMLPYGGTPIRTMLAQEGRLKGNTMRPDYDFLDRRLNSYYALLREAARPWIHDGGLSHEINWAWEELEVVERLLPEATGGDGYRRDLTALTADSNARLFNLVERSSRAYEQGDKGPLDSRAAKNSAKEVQIALVELRDRFIAKNVDLLMESIDRTRVSGPVTAPQIH